jgi:NADH-quinone oxidoreductase subunit J
VHSLLSLITVFFITTLLYIYAGAEFLAFLFLIVYVGAIAILFLFVIILLQIKDTLTETNVTNTGTVLISLPVAVVVVIGLEDFIIQSFTETFIYNNVQTNTEGVNVVEALTYYVNYKFADILLFSTLLYTEYSFLLFLAALLLLTAIIGAIVLAISAVTIPTIKNPMKTTMNVLTQTIENNKPVTTLKKTNISFFSGRSIKLS